MEQNRQDADAYQRTRNTQVQPVHCNHRQRHEDKVKLSCERLLAEPNDRGQDQTNRRGRHAFQRSRNPDVVTVDSVEHCPRRT